MRRIRTRLIIAFIFVVLLPAIPLSLVVRDLLERSFGPSLTTSLEEALQAGLDESRDRLQERKQRLHQWLPTALADESRLRQAQEPVVLCFVDSVGGGRLLTTEQAGMAGAPVLTVLRAWAEGAQQGAGSAAPAPGQVLAGPERVGRVMALAIVGSSGRIVVLAERLPENMAARAKSMSEGLSLLRLLREDRPAVLRSYVVPFLLTYAVLLIIALVLGMVLARRIARPIESLVASIKQVGAGDLDTRVEMSAPGEVGDLVQAFNRMVSRLAAQRHELARLERIAAWRDLARTLAHEIKNPLTPILLAVQSARENYHGDDAQHAALLAECEEIVSEEVMGLRNLVREFSEFARLPQPQPVSGDLAALLRELARLYGEEKVRCDVPAAGLTASFDAAELRRALINLIDNSLAACREAGQPEQVVITARVTAAEVEITVRDAGVGIDEDNLARIFEPNFSTKKEGMGLGLPIVEGIIKGHGGGISVQSQPGEGTSFRLRLPVGADQPGLGGGDR